LLYSIALFSNDSFITGDSEGSLKLWEMNLNKTRHLVKCGLLSIIK
jgi:hypothetical protein